MEQYSDILSNTTRKLGRISEKKLKRISKTYTDNKSKIYWVHQSIQPANYNTQWKNRMNLIRDKCFEDQYYADCIIEILTEEQFLSRFSSKVLG
jgi:hypothetical protein